MQLAPGVVLFAPNTLTSHVEAEPGLSSWMAQTHVEELQHPQLEAEAKELEVADPSFTDGEKADPPASNGKGKKTLKNSKPAKPRRKVPVKRGPKKQKQ